MHSFLLDLHFLMTLKKKLILKYDSLFMFTENMTYNNPSAWSKKQFRLL